MSVRWDEIADVFSRALDVPPAQREAWLAAECADRPELRQEVAAMLLAHEPEARLEIEEQLLSAHDHVLPTDTRLGGYRILRWLGRGGMGEVYLGTRADADFEQLVAIKLLRVEVGGGDAAARFRRERRILAHLTHPAVVPLLDSGVAPDGRPYLVLQYVEGEPITRWCDVHDLSIDARLRLFTQVCRAVQYAHGRLIIHRDLKPSNILVTPDGEPRLLDFGIAKVLTPDEDETELTHRDPAPMTPERAAPEQLRGELPSTATDVWALGVLLYELLAGRLPFDVTGRSRAEIERAVTDEPVPRLRLRPWSDIDTVITTALRREPEQRYASAGQLADDVERVLAGQPILARPQSLGYRMRRFVGRNRVSVAASALAVVALIVFSITTALQWARVARERDRAAMEEVKANAVVDLLVEILGGANPINWPGGPTINVPILLARGEKRADALGDQPEVQARLWHVLGKVHLERSNFVRARKLLARAYAKQVAISGESDARAIEMGYDLARAEMRSGDRLTAERRLRRLLTRIEAGTPAKPAMQASVLNDLAELLGDAEGEPLARRALYLRRALVPPDPIAVAESLNALAIILAARGANAEAVGSYREALALLRPRLMADHPFVLAVENNLSVVVSDSAERARMMRERIRLHTLRFGEDSQQVALAWNNLGVALAEGGDLAGGRAAFGESLARWTRIAGRDHPQALNTRRSIATLDLLTGHVQDALGEIEDIQTVMRRRGESAAWQAEMQAFHGAALFRLGRVDDAERETASALAELRRLQPPGAPQRTGVELGHGLLLLAKGDAAGAERALRQVLAVREKSLPPDHAQRAEAQVALGRALVGLGRMAEGRTLLEAGIERFAAFGASHPDDVAAGRAALKTAAMSGSRR